MHTSKAGPDVGLSSKWDDGQERTQSKSRSFYEDHQKPPTYGRVHEDEHWPSGKPYFKKGHIHFLIIRQREIHKIQPRTHRAFDKIQLIGEMAELPGQFTLCDDE